MLRYLKTLMHLVHIKSFSRVSTLEAIPGLNILSDFSDYLNHNILILSFIEFYLLKHRGKVERFTYP